MTSVSVERYRLHVGLVLAGWGLGFVQAILHLAMYAAQGRPLRWDVVGWNWLSYGVAALFLPWLVERARAVPFERSHWLRQLPAHLARAAAASILEASLYLLIRKVVQALGGTPYETGQLALALLEGIFLSNLYLFTAVSIAASAVQGAIRLQEKNVAAARLESELASTRLRLLKAQLNPHFLFNTLHTVSSLVSRDPAAANRTISRLSDFLRVLLETSGQEEVTLEQELEHLTLYVRIQETRFRERLVFEIDLGGSRSDLSDLSEPREPSDLLRVLVPHMILQPLVENSIEHGSSPRKVLTVRVGAQRIGDWLEIAVEDDGRGPATRATPAIAAVPRGGHHGVGLASARARLHALYGAEQPVLAEARAGGGSVVRFRVPWRLQPGTERTPVDETSRRLDVGPIRSSSSPGS